MPVSVPATRSGAEYPLGLFEQTGGFGVPATPASTPGNWINWASNTLAYKTGAHMIPTAMGTRATQQESAQGETGLGGSFGCTLRTSTARTIVKALLGTTDGGTLGVETFSVSRPQLLTIVDALAGEARQYQDCLLSKATLQCGNHMEWTWSVDVLGGLLTLITSVVPAFTTGERTKAWADVTGISGLSALPGQISQFSLVFDNMGKLDYGAGQHAATAVLGADFSVTGSFLVRYDSAAAAVIHANYRSGLDLGPTDLTIGPAGDVHTIHLPNVTLLECPEQKSLDDFERLQVNFGVKGAQGVTYAMPVAV